MINKPLYRFIREDGGVTTTPDRPSGSGYTIMRRLIADEGKILTNGKVMTPCVDAANAEGWTEVDDNSERSAE